MKLILQIEKIIHLLGELMQEKMYQLKMIYEANKFYNSIKFKFTFLYSLNLRFTYLSKNKLSQPIKKLILCTRKVKFI